MFTIRWQLLRLLGIPIGVDASWLVILALVTWSLAGNFHEVLPEQQPWIYWVMGLVTALVFFLCIVLHELGHAVVARATGMPIRGITLFLFGGVAELGGEPHSAGREFAMAIAGPIVSAILAVVFWLVASAGEAAGWATAIVLCLLYIAGINFTVLLFNLVPAFPLDGGRVLHAAIWGATGDLRRATHWASLAGQVFAWLLIFFGIVNFFWGNVVGGIWLGLIGWFLNHAARASYSHVLIRETLSGEPLRRFMNPHPIIVPPSLDLRHWVEDYVYRFHRKTFPVASNGHLEGIISTRVLDQLPREEWEHHTVGELMRNELQEVSIPPDADTLQALEKMQRTGSSRLLVTEGDQLVGIVSLKDLLRFLRLKLDAERPI
jgi:Zn-dependent protease/CBS domain-containing protein